MNYQKIQFKQTLTKKPLNNTVHYSIVLHIKVLMYEDQPRIIPVKFGQNPISGLGGDVIWRNCLRMDGRGMGGRMHK